MRKSKLYSVVPIPARCCSRGREVVKTVWQTANILRKEGFGAAVRSNIEDLAD